MQNSKLQFKIQNFKFLTVVFSFLFLVFSLMLTKPAMAAILYLQPSQGQYHQSDTFIVDVNIDTKDQCINAVDIEISFPQDILKGINFSKGESIIVFWTEKPVINQELGLVSFVGGIPGGYCGILPGDPREHSHLGRIIFKAKEIRGEQFSAELKFLDTSQVLLNDGFGTPTELFFKRAFYTILPEKREIPEDKWQEKIKADIVPPELFEVEIKQDPAIFDGKYFIIFFTTDKQTGLNYFEVQEGRREWQRAESPYLLKDQTLRSIIRVRAVDMAGNERIIELQPLKKPFPYWAIILVLITAGVIWGIIRILKRKT